MALLECDILIIGAGIAGITFAEKLVKKHDVDILIAEAGTWLPFEQTAERTRRWHSHREFPYSGDALYDGLTGCVGGRATHWEGFTPRFAPSDFDQSRVAPKGFDWPISYEDLEPYYVEAEQLVGVAGEPPMKSEGRRSAPFPMAAAPLNYNMHIMQKTFSRGGIQTATIPTARNTSVYDGRSACMRCDSCQMCPTGARYNPHFKARQLVAERKIRIVTRTHVTRLVPKPGSDEIDYAECIILGGNSRRKVRIKAKKFVCATNWRTPALLLGSATSHYPEGLANASGLVGCYFTAHPIISTVVEIPEQLYPGIHRFNRLHSMDFCTDKPTDSEIRFGFQALVVPPQSVRTVIDKSGRPLLGDALLHNWRNKATGVGRFSILSYVDTFPLKSSRAKIAKMNPDGLHDVSFEFNCRKDLNKKKVLTSKKVGDMNRKLKASGATIKSQTFRLGLNHIAGGCRMGTDPQNSVCNHTGQTHQHENLFVAGGPLAVSPGVVNSTITHVAMALRTADFVGKDFPLRSL